MRDLPEAYQPLNQPIDIFYLDINSEDLNCWHKVRIVGWKIYYTKDDEEQANEMRLRFICYDKRIKKYIRLERYRNYWRLKTGKITKVCKASYLSLPELFESENILF